MTVNMDKKPRASRQRPGQTSVLLAAASFTLATADFTDASVILIHPTKNPAR